MTERLGTLRSLSLNEAEAGVTVIGKRFEAACHDVRDFLLRNQVAYEWIESDDGNAAARYPEITAYPSAIALVRLLDGTLLVDPALREVASALGLGVVPQAPDYDIIVVGAGPAGLAAAVYGASEGLRTLVIEREAPGGQAGSSSQIENYLGFPSGISGDELTDRALRQARRLGAEIVLTREVTTIGLATVDREIALDASRVVRARVIILATGVRWRTLDVPGAERLLGRGLYYGAAQTEANSMRGKDIFIVGGGNSAGQAAMFFSNYASNVTLLVRAASLAKNMSAYLIAEIRTKSNIIVTLETEVLRLYGDEHLQAIEARHCVSGNVSRHPAEGVYVFIGADAATSWLPEQILRDNDGFILTGNAIPHDSWPANRDPYLLETSAPGVFAVGDVRHGSMKRVAAAVGEGSMAVAFTHQYLENVQGKMTAGNAAS